MLGNDCTDARPSNQEAHTSFSLFTKPRCQHQESCLRPASLWCARSYRPGVRMAPRPLTRSLLFFSIPTSREEDPTYEREEDKEIVRATTTAHVRVIGGPRAAGCERSRQSVTWDQRRRSQKINDFIWRPGWCYLINQNHHRTAMRRLDGLL